MKLVTAIALLTISTGAAQAACTPSDGAGVWRIYNGTDLAKCKITLAPSGDVVLSNSFCTFRNSSNVYWADAGSIFVSSTCRTKGVIKFVRNGDFRPILKIVDGQLTADKTLMTGVLNLHFEDPYVFVGIRQTP
jgi:hypothetical protein